MTSKKRVNFSIEDKLKALETLETPRGAKMKVADHLNIYPSLKSGESKE